MAYRIHIDEYYFSDFPIYPPVQKVNDYINRVHGKAKPITDPDELELSRRMIWLSMRDEGFDIAPGGDYYTYTVQKTINKEQLYNPDNCNLSCLDTTYDVLINDDGDFERIEYELADNFKDSIIMLYEIWSEMEYDDDMDFIYVDEYLGDIKRFIEEV